ncbi:hypothetical protein BN1200_410017 [Klebsiella variicola]|nr:hypothetical protein BN1200_410017 [Klebsiella variicola]
MRASRFPLQGTNRVIVHTASITHIQESYYVSVW